MGKTCEKEVQSSVKYGGIHAVMSPHLGCGFDWQQGQNRGGQDL